MGVTACGFVFVVSMALPRHSEGFWFWRDGECMLGFFFFFLFNALIKNLEGCGRFEINEIETNRDNLILDRN